MKDEISFSTVRASSFNSSVVDVDFQTKKEDRFVQNHLITESKQGSSIYSQAYEMIDLKEESYFKANILHSKQSVCPSNKESEAPNQYKRKVSSSRLGGESDSKILKQNLQADQYSSEPTKLKDSPQGQVIEIALSYKEKGQESKMILQKSSDLLKICPDIMNLNQKAESQCNFEIVNKPDKTSSLIIHIPDQFCEEIIVLYINFVNSLSINKTIQIHTSNIIQLLKLSEFFRNTRTTQHLLKEIICYHINRTNSFFLLNYSHSKLLSKTTFSNQEEYIQDLWFDVFISSLDCYSHNLSNLIENDFDQLCSISENLLEEILDRYLQNYYSILKDSNTKRDIMKDDLIGKFTVQDQIIQILLHLRSKKDLFEFIASEILSLKISENERLSEYIEFKAKIDEGCSPISSCSSLVCHYQVQAEKYTKTIFNEEIIDVQGFASICKFKITTFNKISDDCLYMNIEALFDDTHSISLACLLCCVWIEGQETMSQISFRMLSRKSDSNKFQGFCGGGFTKMISKQPVNLCLQLKPSFKIIYATNYILNAVHKLDLQMARVLDKSSAKCLLYNLKEKPNSCVRLLFAWLTCDLNLNEDVVDLIHIISWPGVEKKLLWEFVIKFYSTFKSSDSTIKLLKNALESSTKSIRNSQEAFMNKSIKGSCNYRCSDIKIQRLSPTRLRDKESNLSNIPMSDDSNCENILMNNLGFQSSIIDNFTFDLFSQLISIALSIDYAAIITELLKLRKFSQIGRTVKPPSVSYTSVNSSKPKVCGCNSVSLEIAPKARSNVLIASKVLSLEIKCTERNAGLNYVKRIESQFQILIEEAPKRAKQQNESIKNEVHSISLQFNRITSKFCSLSSTRSELCFRPISKPEPEPSLSIKPISEIELTILKKQELSNLASLQNMNLKSLKYNLTNFKKSEQPRMENASPQIPSNTSIHPTKSSEFNNGNFNNEGGNDKGALSILRVVSRTDQSECTLKDILKEVQGDNITKEAVPNHYYKSEEYLETPSAMTINIKQTNQLELEEHYLNNEYELKKYFDEIYPKEKLVVKEKRIKSQSTNLNINRTLKTSKAAEINTFRKGGTIINPKCNLNSVKKSNLGVGSSIQATNVQRASKQTSQAQFHYDNRVTNQNTVKSRNPPKTWRGLASAAQTSVPGKLNGIMNEKYDCTVSREQFLKRSMDITNVSNPLVEVVESMNKFLAKDEVFNYNSSNGINELKKREGPSTLINKCYKPNLKSIDWSEIKGNLSRMNSTRKEAVNHKVKSS